MHVALFVFRVLGCLAICWFTARFAVWYGKVLAEWDAERLEGIRKKKG